MVLMSLFIGCERNQDSNILSGQEEINARLDSLSTTIKDKPVSRMDLMKVAFDSLAAYNYAATSVDIDTTDDHNHIQIKYVEYYTFEISKDSNKSLWDGDWHFRRVITENFEEFSAEGSIHSVATTPVIYHSYGKFRLVDERNMDMLRTGGRSYSLRFQRWSNLDSGLMGVTKYVFGEDEVFLGDERSGMSFRVTHMSNSRTIESGLLDF